MRGETPYATLAVGDAQEAGTSVEANLACVLAANRRWNGTSHCIVGRETRECGDSQARRFCAKPVRLYRAVRPNAVSKLTPSERKSK